MLREGNKFTSEKMQWDASVRYIDTLCLSPLLFPAKPYHRLLKEDKLQTDSLSNPLDDAVKSRELFCDEMTAFEALDDRLQQIWYVSNRALFSQNLSGCIKSDRLLCAERRCGGLFPLDKTTGLCLPLLM